MSIQDLKFAFLGTPDVASRTLEILFENGYIPTVIVTSPDARSGRGMHMTPSPVSLWAEAHHIECLKPEKITAEFIEDFKKYNLDVSIVVAYGKILPEKLITVPPLGTLNIHYSLLPLYRGASPLEEALLHGDTVTGVSIQQMRFKLDSGPVLSEKKIEIGADEKKQSLRNRLIQLGAKTLVDILPDIINGTVNPVEQDESHASYCTKIKKEDGQIDLNGNSEENYNKYRAYEGWPGTYFFVERHGKNIRVKITEARYENNSFVIERVIPEGKKEMLYSDFLKGFN
jgi:methionyl-tRNA formyltransferase